MKKILYPFLIGLCCATLFSCTKEHTENLISKPDPVITASNWLSVSFTEVNTTPTTRNLSFLLGDHIIISPANYNTGEVVQLAYARIPAGWGYDYFQLPGVYSVASRNTAFLFDLTPSVFSIQAWDERDGSRLPDATGLQAFRFRYVVVLQEVYDSLRIDWGNYAEVVKALGLGF